MVFPTSSKSHSPDESQTPIVLLTCSFEHQAGEQVQLNFDEMEVLFHEMGHALHSMVLLQFFIRQSI